MLPCVTCNAPGLFAPYLLTLTLMVMPSVLFHSPNSSLPMPLSTPLQESTLVSG